MLIYDLPVGLATARLVADSFKGSLMTTMFRRFVVLAVVVIAAIATPALAQPAGELFIGYSYLRADPGEVEGAGGATASLDSANLHGTELSGTWFVNRNTGVEVSFGYHRGSISLSGLTLPDLGIDLRSADVTQYTFLVGPRYRVVSTRRHHVDVRALFGGASLNFDVPVSVSTFKSEEFGFAATFGGSYTLVLNDVFSFRVIQPDVLISTAGSTRTNFRLSTGIVFRYQ